MICASSYESHPTRRENILQHLRASKLGQNPRNIERSEYERLQRRITKHGQFKPIIVTPDGITLGGNQRLRAYRDLGITDVWVSVVEPKTEKEMLELALVDNERSGSWDEQQLAELVLSVPELQLEDFKIDLGTPIGLDTLVDRFGPEPVEEVGDGNEKCSCGCKISKCSTP